MAVIRLVVLTCLVAVAVAKEEIAIQSACDDVDYNACTVSQVRIDPCKVNKPCIFTQGGDVKMEFDFTPNFNTSNLKTGVYYNDMSFSELSSDACELTTCPLVAGRQHQFNYSLHIGKKLPIGRFPISWKVWNGDNDKEVCCFKTTIVIVKGKKN